MNRRRRLRWSEWSDFFGFYKIIRLAFGWSVAMLLSVMQRILQNAIHGIPSWMWNLMRPWATWGDWDVALGARRSFILINEFWICSCCIMMTQMYIFPFSKHLALFTFFFFFCIRYMQIICSFKKNCNDCIKWESGSGETRCGELKSDSVTLRTWNFDSVKSISM